MGCEVLCPFSAVILFLLRENMVKEWGDHEAGWWASGRRLFPGSIVFSRSESLEDSNFPLFYTKFVPWEGRWYGKTHVDL